LQRFTEEVDRFTPDLILVSFGWNDAAPAIGEPDKSFAETSRRLAANPSLLFLRRVLLGYRSLLVARRVFDGRAQPAVATKSDSPRVSLADYEANLRAFIDSAQTKGIVPVLLTRPHRAPAQALRREPTWRHDVPDYNAVALRVAHERHVPVVDVQRAFDERPGLFVDECHFTEEGHHEMATLIDQALANAGLLR